MGNSFLQGNRPKSFNNLFVKAHCQDIQETLHQTIAGKKDTVLHQIRQPVLTARQKPLYNE